MDFEKLTDLAAERLGGAVLWATDDFFAEKENLIKASEPVWKEEVYTDNGKWMDGWESRRKRTPGHDICILRLGVPGVIDGVVVDTAFFRGNYPEQCSLEGCALDGNPSLDDLLADDLEWTEILPVSQLQGNSKHPFAIESTQRWTHLRFHIYPDGGVARLRVHGEPSPSIERLRRPELDLAALELGGRVLSQSDMFFGDANNLLLPGRGINMGDGWETKRRRGPGHDWAIVQLAGEGEVRHIEVDTLHFKGNYPDRFTLEGLCAPDANPDTLPNADWQPLIGETKLQAHTLHEYTLGPDVGPLTHLRLAIYPDGGVSRLRARGSMTREGFQRRALRQLNSLSAQGAEAELLACCGASRWARDMARERPFTDLNHVLAEAGRHWDGMTSKDWLEAFLAHPPIGGRKAKKDTGARARGWSDGEQAGTRTASEAEVQELARLNTAYADKFGFVFLICATGKSAGEMLDALRSRLENDRDTELHIAAAEQDKITAIRLTKLLTVT